MTATLFPFERLGLSRNPFGSLQPHEWADIAVIPPPVDDLLRQKTHMLFLGDKGRGKTSLLYGIQQRLTYAGQQVIYERLPRLMSDYQSDIRGLDAFALDEAQRLYPHQWIALLRAAQRGTRLLIASHLDVSLLFRLSRQPLTRLHMDDIITPAHIRAVHTRRIACFTLPDYTPIAITDNAIDYLWQQYATNLRAQESLLYNVFQQMQQPDAITVAHLQRAR